MKKGAAGPRPFAEAACAYWAAATGIFRVVPGATSQYVFHTSAQTAALAFSTPVAVPSAPAQLEVEGDGGNYQYGTIGLSIYRLGDIPDSN